GVAARTKAMVDEGLAAALQMAVDEVWWRTEDEIGSVIDRSPEGKGHFAKCETCVAAFVAWLKGQGLAPAALGKKDWAGGPPAAPAARGRGTPPHTPRERGAGGRPGPPTSRRRARVPRSSRTTPRCSATSRRRSCSRR